MEKKLTDREVLARLIYRAYIAPDPHAPLEAEALLPFQAALELYARTWRADDNKALMDRSCLTPFYFVRGGIGGGTSGGDGAGGTFWTPRSDLDPETDPACDDSCPVELPEDPQEEPAPPLREKDLDGFQPVSVKLKGADTHTHSRGH